VDNSVEKFGSVGPDINEALTFNLLHKKEAI
jgi:hypothetical protein